MNDNLLNALASQLDLSRSQKRCARGRFLSLDLSKWGQRAEVIAFCVCAVTVHPDETNREYHPNQAIENRDLLFSKIADSLGISETMIRREYGKVEAHFRRSNAGDLN